MEISEKVMSAFWAKMVAMYGATWSRDMGVQPPADGPIRDEWESVVAEMSTDQLRCGFNAARASGSEWPPTVPRFRAMCFGVPSLPSVQFELSPNFKGDRSAFSRLVWSFVDAFEYRQSSSKAADKMVSDAFSLAREHVMRGGELPEVVAAIERAPDPPKPRPTSPEQAKAHIERLKSILNSDEVDQ